MSTGAWCTISSDSARPRVPIGARNAWRPIKTSPKSTLPTARELDSITGSEGVAEESPGDTGMAAARRPARTGTRGKPALYASMGVTENWRFNPVGTLEGASNTYNLIGG